MTTVQDERPEDRLRSIPESASYAVASPPPSPRPLWNDRSLVFAAAFVVLVVCVAVAGIALAKRAGQGDPQATAIQQVIRQADSEQAQALAQNDPSLMRDTATAVYYLQVAQSTRQQRIQGATGMNVIDLVWGPISIQGATATAITYKTLLTGYVDGFSFESTDTNVYTLVQRNGSWLIDSDRQVATVPTAPYA